MHQLILGGTRDQRLQIARAAGLDASAIRLDAATLPFMRLDTAGLPAPPRILFIAGLELAFPDAQAGGTRLVLTQSTYLLQKWIDVLDMGDRIIATADRAALERCAPEAFQGRGPWESFKMLDAGVVFTTEDTVDAEERTPTFFSAVSTVSPVVEMLVRGFIASDPAERLRLCREAAALDATCEVAQLALASACRESRDGEGARAALDRAAVLAPGWEAIAYESGKLWLVHDELARARDEFQRAADLMPAFSAAFSNLGAALGELGEPAAALAAFRRALAHDPRSFTILNNIGVVSRELGRFDDSEAAFRQVIAISPAFVFGHYNLGHTLFLRGDYAAALTAYEEGQRRDPQQNRRQGCRLAVVRFATGDLAGAEHDLWRFADAAPADEREDLLLEAYEIAHALLIQHPALAAQQAFLDRIGAEIAESE